MTTSNPYKAPQTRQGAMTPAVDKPDLMALLFSFTGRAPRRHFWGVQITASLAVILFAIGLMAILGRDSSVALLLVVVAEIIMFWVCLVVSIKRWHDRDKSGWWILINLVPVVGTIWSFVEVGCLRGTRGPNQFGPDPT